MRILAFFLLGMILFGLGLIGEYVGRIYGQVRERPRYVIQAILEAGRDAGTDATASALTRVGAMAAAGVDPIRPAGTDL